MNFKKLEEFLFSHRLTVLVAAGILTVVMAVFAVRLHMDAGFEKQMPTNHEYIKTFMEYRDQLFGANRLTVVVRARDPKGTIWTKEGLERLYKVNQAVTLLPNIDRLGVQSLWTPNSFVNQITEEGFTAQPVIPGTVTVDSLDKTTIDKIRAATSEGGFIGTLVSHDETSAMITAEIGEADKDGHKLDYIAYNRLLNQKIRGVFEDDKFEIQIIGFAKQIGDISDGASSVLVFCAIALLLTALAVYWYCRSVRLTILPIVCSLTSLVWQFGTLNMMGYGLDPLAVLVPFLVFAIGVSHGVQQINYIVREIAHGRKTFDAARLSFSGLLVPGVLALVTAMVSFITLLLVPIPMVKELAVVSSIGVTYKIITNLVLLPVAASYFNFSSEFAVSSMLKREQRSGWLRGLSHISNPRNATIVACIAVVVFGVAVWQSRDRVVGTVQPGAPELREDARFNRDAASIAASYDMGLDWLTVVFQSPPNSCGAVNIAKYQDDFVASVEHIEGVKAIKSFAGELRSYNQGYNEGNPKMEVVPLDPVNYSGLATEIGRGRGFVSTDCSMSAVHIYLADHKAVTINRLIAAVKKFRTDNPMDGVKIRLASGNAGVLAATNEAVAQSELPMMLNVYIAIALLVLIAYRDVRAVIACCLPLTLSTFIGYWFMKECNIGLTVATLPVMVLAVGIGVDYAFYIYNRLQMHLVNGENMKVALEHAILEVGMATIFTAVTLAIGVATWSFSELKFQADMGKLLAFMFIVNLIMAMTVLPAVAVLLDKAWPRKTPVRGSALFNH
jgi:predicted RND superfamily exporter protein